MVRISHAAAALILLFVVGLAAPARGQKPPERGRELLDQIVERIVAGEAAFLDRFAEYEPFMETYIQARSEGAGESEVEDQYLLGRVRLGDGVEWTTYSESRGFQRPSKFLFFKRSSKGFLPEGFAQMIVPDAFELNQETYAFDYLRREFLGEVRTLVFDVRPTVKTRGKFLGRIWVEDRDYRIVRFNGTYTGGSSSLVFFHFDSWRVNVEDDFWAPAFIYIEDEDKSSGTGSRFRAQSRLWDYNTVENSRLDELTAILIESDQQVSDETAVDPAPLEAQRLWQRQAQQNVIERLERAGLLAPKGPVEIVLNTVVNNLMATNDIDLDVECRVLLTTPLETFSIGQAIVVSRGLLDTLPDEPSLAMALSDELAHIVLGHRMETMYAFSDWAIFEDEEILDRLRLRREPQEVRAAGVKAVEILGKSPYADRLASAGLYLKALLTLSSRLPNLIESNFGNEIASQEELLRLTGVAASAPALEEDRVDQIAALPLGSRVKVDPWTNAITLGEAKAVTMRSARDKLPFEVTPFMPYLKRFEAPPQEVDPNLSSQAR